MKQALIQSAIGAVVALICYFPIAALIHEPRISAALAALCGILAARLVVRR